MTESHAVAASSGADLPSGAEFLAQERKTVAVFGMSGVGKTMLAKKLRKNGNWFHYSVDYRIGTRYLDEEIVDLFKREAMKSPFLREMLLSDSVQLVSNIRFENLTPISAYLGQPGDPLRGGLAFEEYVRRQRLHRAAEIRSMEDALSFMAKARELYGYPHFLCDTSGSLVEVVDASDPADPIMSALSGEMIFVYIRGEEADEDELARRFDEDPKPIYFDEEYLRTLWESFRKETGDAESAVDPDAFARYAFRRLIGRRTPRYQAIADRWGVSLAKSAVARLEDEPAFLALVAEALDAKRADQERVRRGTGS